MINQQEIFRNQICSLGSLQNHCLKEHRGALQHQKLSLDLNLAATQYTNDSRTLLGDCYTSEVSALTEHGIYKPSTDGLKLCLRAGGQRTYEDNFIYSPSLQSIRYGYDSEASCSSKSRKNDSFAWIPGDGRANLSGRNHFYQGVEQCHEEVSCNNKSARRKLFTSVEVELDLNKIPPNESSFEPWIFDPSQCKPSSVSHESEGKTCWRSSISELNVKKKEDSLSSQELVEGTDSNRSPVSCKSDLIRDDVLSNKKKDIPTSKLVQQNVLPSSRGAVSLLYLSARNQDLPQISSESYESIVLKQEECSIDESCVSSTPFEATGLDKIEHGVKLKRGRRMKDFRKEILPSLGSLSRKEINEDIKIMDIALRSREYKKYRSKIASKSECITPVRSWRS
ncbi:hypothetical protein ACS0TY_001432 [Phlomoides rotata]